MVNRRRNGDGSVYTSESGKLIRQKVVFIEGYGKKRFSGSGETERKANRQMEENILKFKRKLAEQQEQKQQQEIEAANKSKQVGTLGEHVERLIGNNKSCEHTTMASYQQEFDFYIKPFPISNMEMSVITKDDILGHYRYLLEHGKKRTGKGLSYVSVNKARFLIRKAFVVACEEGMLEKNVHAGIAKFNAKSNQDMEMLEMASKSGKSIEENNKIRYMEPKELQDFLKASEDMRLHTLFFIAASTGCRKGELLGLRWRDVDLVAKTFKIESSLAYVTKKNDDGSSIVLPVLKATKNRSSKRKFIMTDEIYQAFQQTKRMCENDKVRYGRKYKDYDLVFCDEQGDYYTRGEVRYGFDKCIKSAGIKNNFTFHSLRHTFCSILVSNNVDMKTVQSLLGHSHITTTLGIYADVFEFTRVNALEGVSNMLTQNMGAKRAE